MTAAAGQYPMTMVSVVFWPVTVAVTVVCWILYVLQVQGRKDRARVIGFVSWGCTCMLVVLMGALVAMA
jgi:hypothetical protein